MNLSMIGPLYTCSRLPSSDPNIGWYRESCDRDWIRWEWSNRRYTISLLKGDLAFEEGDYEEALNAFRGEDFNPELAMRMVRTYRRLGFPDSAAIVLRRCRGAFSATQCEH